MSVLWFGEKEEAVKLWNSLSNNPCLCIPHKLQIIEGYCNGYIKQNFQYQIIKDERKCEVTDCGQPANAILVKTVPKYWK